MKRISSHYLLTPQGLLPGKVVVVNDSGTIAGIYAPKHLDRESGVEFHPGILIPGFVNSHCHLELSYLQDAIPQGRGFTQFAKDLKAKRGRFSDMDRLTAADFRDAKMWDEGISAVADVCNGASTFFIKGRSRIQYHNFIELFGLNAETEAAFTMCGAARNEGLDATVTPHSTYSLNLAQFAAAVDGANNRPISVHFMESPDEVELFGKSGPLWEWYSTEGMDPDFTGYGSPAERLTAQVPPDRPVMLVHNCCVTQRDIDIVMEHFTAQVTWVLCPGSNRYISGMEPPVGLLRRNGLHIAVGTDSLASNDALSMVHELCSLGDWPLAEMLGWATRNGAEALGLADRFGTVEVGKSPGLVLLTGVDMDTMTIGAKTEARRIV